VEISNANALGEPTSFSALDGTFVQSGASLHLEGGAYTVSEDFQIEGTGVNGEGAISNSNGAGNHTIAGDIVLTADAAVGVASTNGQLTLDGIIRSGSEVNDFTKVGAGTVFLAGTENNNILGEWFVNAGTLVLNKNLGVDAVNNRLTIGDGTGTDVVRFDNSVQ